MPENCETGKDCPYETRFALLEMRVEALQDGQTREEAFRKTYYADREARGARDAALDAKLDGMNEKLDKLLGWQSEQQAKPVKRWDGMVDKIIWAVLAAVIAFLLARMGL